MDSAVSRFLRVLAERHGFENAKTQRRKEAAKIFFTFCLATIFAFLASSRLQS
jgi:hypothetical protein